MPQERVPMPFNFRVMKKTTLLLFSLLTLAACNKGETSGQNEQEAQLEEAATNVEEAAAEDTAQSPAGAETPAPAPVELPDEPMPGATSTASAAPSAANPLFNFTLRPGQAGAVQVGMNIAEVKRQYGETKLRETTLQQEGTDTKAYEVLGERRRTDLVVEQQCKGTTCKVYRITVMNPAFKTESGLGIGSTMADLKKNLSISSIGVGEGKLVAISENARMSFVLETATIPSSKWANLKVNDVPESTPVTSILLY